MTARLHTPVIDLPSSGLDQPLRPSSSTRLASNGHARDAHYLYSNRYRPQYIPSLPQPRHDRARRDRHFRGRVRSEWQFQEDYLRLIRERDKREQYVKYREGQHQHNEGRAQRQDAPVWPSHVEDVFWQALVEHPPMGREKHRVNSDDSKPKGRNELIAQYLYDRLGDTFTALESRKDDGKKGGGPRKVVSSHLQVLKQKYTDKVQDEEGNTFYIVPEECQFVMYWLGGLDNKKGTKKRGPVQHAHVSSYHHHSYLEPSSVEIFLQDGATKQALHYFAQTERIPSPGPELDFNTRPNWELEFPELAAYLEQNGRPDCDVIIADTSLDMPCERLPGMNKDPAPQLTIENVFGVPRSNLPQRDPQFTTFSFYIDGERDTDEGTFTGIHCRQGEHPGLFYINMGSEYWVKLLGSMWAQNTRRRLSLNMKHQSADDSVLYAEMRDHIVNRLRSTTIIQEVFNDVRIDPDDENSAAARQRLVVICWKFSAAPEGTPGRTSWKRVILPAGEDFEASAVGRSEWATRAEDIDALQYAQWQTADTLDTEHELYAPFVPSDFGQLLTNVGSLALMQDYERYPESITAQQALGGRAEGYDLGSNHLALPLDPAIVRDGQAQSGYAVTSMNGATLQDPYDDHQAIVSGQPPMVDSFFELSQGEGVPSGPEPLDHHFGSHYATMSSLRGTLQSHAMPSHHQGLPYRPVEQAYQAQVIHTPSNMTVAAHPEQHTQHLDPSIDPAQQLHNEHASYMTQSIVLPGQDAPVANMSYQQPGEDIDFVEQTHHMSAAQQASAAYQHYINAPHVSSGQLDHVSSPPAHEHRYETRTKQRQQEHQEHLHDTPVHLGSQQTADRFQPYPANRTLSHLLPRPILPSQDIALDTDVARNYPTLAERRGLYATTISTQQSSCFEGVTPAPTTAATESFDFAHHFPPRQEVEPVMSARSSPGKPTTLLEAQAEAMATSEAPHSAQPGGCFGFEFGGQGVQRETNEGVETGIGQHLTAEMHTETDMSDNAHGANGFDADALGLIFDPSLLSFDNANGFENDVVGASSTVSPTATLNVNSPTATLDSQAAGYNPADTFGHINASQSRTFSPRLDPSQSTAFSHVHPSQSQTFSPNITNTTTPYPDFPATKETARSIEPNSPSTERPTKRLRALRSSAGDDVPQWADGTPELDLGQLSRSMSVAKHEDAAESLAGGLMEEMQGREGHDSMAGESEREREKSVKVEEGWVVVGAQGS